MIEVTAALLAESTEITQDGKLNILGTFYVGGSVSLT
jgi:hypothetical protein